MFKIGTGIEKNHFFSNFACQGEGEVIVFLHLSDLSVIELTNHTDNENILTTYFGYVLVAYIMMAPPLWL